MATARSTQPEHIPVTEASARGIARLAKDAEAGHSVIITRHGKPVAAIVPIANAPTSRSASGQAPQPDPAPVSATQRWVQAVNGTGRTIPGPPGSAR